MLITAMLPLQYQNNIFPAIAVMNVKLVNKKNH